VPSRHQPVHLATIRYGLWKLTCWAFFSPSISSRHIGGLASTAMTAASAAAKGLSSTLKYPALAVLDDRHSLDSILSMLDIPEGFAHCNFTPLGDQSSYRRTFRSSLLLWEYGFRTARLASSRVQPQIYDFFLFFCCFFLDLSSLFS
jgi:hypothetical protein